MSIQLTRRSLLGAIPAATATTAWAKPDAPVQDEPFLPSWWQKLVDKAEAVIDSGTPMAGAPDRWVTVPKAKLDDLASAIEGKVVDPKQTVIQRLHAQWHLLTDELSLHDAKWEAKEIDNAEFEEITDPIIERRDAIEEKMINASCENIRDLWCITMIADHFEWLVEDYNSAVLRGAALLAKAA